MDDTYGYIWISTYLDELGVSKDSLGTACKNQVA